MCRLSQWTVTSLLLSAYTQIHRRILSIFKFLRLPQKWTLGWWPQPNVVYMLLLTLGSDTLMKFECSKLLWSSQADQDSNFLLCCLICNLSEPFRSRAQCQLRLILQFRYSGFPPVNAPLQMLIL